MNGKIIETNEVKAIALNDYNKPFGIVSGKVFNATEVIAQYSREDNIGGKIVVSIFNDVSYTINGINYPGSDFSKI